MTPDAGIVGIGDVRMVRTFRVGPDGHLFPVNSARAWTDGWNHAACGRGLSHTPPDPDCRCGFYVYSDPAYVPLDRESGEARLAARIERILGTVKSQWFPVKCRIETDEDVVNRAVPDPASPVSAIYAEATSSQSRRSRSMPSRGRGWCR
jgi:hypothetical protein